MGSWSSCACGFGKSGVSASNNTDFFRVFGDVDCIVIVQAEFEKSFFYYFTGRSGGKGISCG